MARNDDGNGIASHGTTDGLSRKMGQVGTKGYLMGDAAVGGSLAVRDSQEAVSHQALKWGADDMQRRGEIGDVAAEIDVEPLDGLGNGIIGEANGFGKKRGLEMPLAVEP